MSKLWFRVAAGILLLFAIGHTLGFLAFQPATAEGRAVWESMQRVHFSDGHGSFSYGDFYIGFGLFISAFLLFAGWLNWILGGMTDVPQRRLLGWSLVALELVSAGLSMWYFSWAPATLSVAAAFCSAAGALQSNGPTQWWLHEHGYRFAWQERYGAFSVNSGQREMVTHYIDNQAEHHR